MRDVIPGKIELTEVGARHVTRVDAADCWRVALRDGDSRDLLDLTRRAVTSSPRWVESLMHLRNAAVKPFGLKISRREAGTDQLRFPVLEDTPAEVIMGADDTHLSFWVSSRIANESESGGGEFFSLTTYVCIHNGFGRLYWSIVRHFHPTVVKAGLRNL